MPDGRFAPSPTGDLHLGNLRTALIAWFVARSQGSRFAIRMEDLDRASVRPAFVDRQLADLRAIGLDWDGPVTRQSDHLERFREATVRLEHEELTYPCFCTRREIAEAAVAPHGEGPEGAYPGTCRDLDAAGRAEREAAGRPPALRVRSHDTTIDFIDRVRGPQRGVVDDFVIRRNDGTPAYNLAVVVDDAADGIGQVVRGDDLLSSTPRQIYLASLLSVPVPVYAHVPLALGPGGARLAKRDGAVTLADLRDQHHDATAVQSWLLASIGVVPPGHRDGLVPLADVVASFRLDQLPRAPWHPLAEPR